VFGIGEPAVDADVEDTALAADQLYLSCRFDFRYDPSRRTGARFIVSLAAVFDLDAHGLAPRFRAWIAKGSVTVTGYGWSVEWLDGLACPQ